jgi:LysM repeat protein
MNYLSSSKAILFLFIALFSHFYNVKGQSEINCEDIFNKMFDATKNVKTLRANLLSVERFPDHVNYTRYTIKLNVTPYNLYTKDLDKGIEVLYLQGKNDNQATVNPNGFPYVNLHLDPLGKIMRKDQHQTIGRSGFNYISDILYHSLAKYPNAYSDYVKRDPDTVWDGFSCYKMEINFLSYKNNPYVVMESGETVSKLAAEYYLNDFQILTINKISWYDDQLKKGQQILLPGAYAKTTILFIRKDNYLPVIIRAYDDTGLFEEYIYSNLLLNSSIPDYEFTENCPGYHF